MTTSVISKQPRTKEPRRMPRHPVRKLRHQMLNLPKGIVSRDARRLRMVRKIPPMLEGTLDSVAGTPETGDSKLPGQPDWIRNRLGPTVPEDREDADIGTVKLRISVVGLRH